MRWAEAISPVPMVRVAIVAPATNVRDVLVRAAEVGAVEFDEHESERLEPGGAHADGPPPVLATHPPDRSWCEQHGRADILAGESALDRLTASGHEHADVTGFVGWARADLLDQLTAAIAETGGAVIRLAHPPGAQPPTVMSRDEPGRAFEPLVDTYATVPYRDVNPAIVAGLAYVVMFGMMFADAGHGALLLGAALVIRFGHWHRVEKLRRVWAFLAGGGLASIAFGVVYGEFFGPTTVLPVLWLDPMDHPEPLLAAAIGVGAALLAGAYALGTTNRLREGGWRLAAYAPTGLAGSLLFCGLAVLSAGIYFDVLWLLVTGATVVGAALVLVFFGSFVHAGGGGSGTAEASIAIVDVVVRLGSNLVSFVRLAAFGITHAALGAVVWDAVSGSWRHGPVGVAGAVVVFCVGNALTFSLEALVAGVQALRLEYYELFSRVFVDEGTPFRPWHLPVADIDAIEEVSCRAG